MSGPFASAAQAMGEGDAIASLISQGKYHPRQPLLLEHPGATGGARCRLWRGRLVAPRETQVRSTEQYVSGGGRS
jgi:hypothetical protein